MEVKLLPRQKEIYDYPARYKVVSCGRRFGKSTLAAYVLVLEALQNPGCEYWIVSPTFTQSLNMFRMVKQIIKTLDLEKHFPPSLYRAGVEIFVESTRGARIYAKSGDKPDNLRGTGLSGVVLDEAAMLKPDVWYEVISPALMDKQGWAILISTPKGKNWFYKEFRCGVEGTQDYDEEYKAFTFPTWENPIIPMKEIESKRKRMPADAFQQEIEAKFIEGGGLVFRNYRATLTALPSDPIMGRFYVMGVDLAKSDDFTVITVADYELRSMVYKERFNKIDWGYIKQRVFEVSKRYNGAIVMLDSTGVGDPICDDLVMANVPVQGYKFNNTTKVAAIHTLKIMIENRQIELFNDPDLVEEFDAYGYDFTPSGNMVYSAPKGFHDDIVMSTALLAIGLNGGVSACIGQIDTGEEKDDDAYEGIETINVEWDELDERWDDIDEPMMSSSTRRRRLMEASQ